jgi:hypothetical protein
MRETIMKLETMYATASELEALRKLVDAKADASILDKVTGGSAQAMEDVELKIQQLQDLYSEQAAAVTAANEVLSKKANVDVVSALTSAVEEQKASSVPAASIAQLQTTLDSVVAQVEGQEHQLERIQVLLFDRLIP